MLLLVMASSVADLFWPDKAVILRIGFPNHPESPHRRGLAFDARISHDVYRAHPMNSSRRWEIDALRGLMLVLMTVTHLPTRLSIPMGQPFGFVSAAEGFVLLSAYMAGLVYSRLAYRDSIEAMRKAFWRRALKVYLCQAATLLFLFTVIAALGMKVDQPAVKDLLSFYLHDPHTAFFAGLLLIYQPPLLDILPLYVLFMLGSPWVLAWALRRGWTELLVLSFLIWVLAQFGLAGWVYRLMVTATGLQVPFSETGSFVTFSWQLIWMVGLWMGASRNAPDARPFVFTAWVIGLAAAIAITGLAWRHIQGQAPFGADVSLNMLFDKWMLGPLRVLDLLALGIITLRFGPALARWVPRLRWLEMMGAASLPVFCAQLVVVLLVLTLFGGNPLLHPWWVDALLLLSCFAWLYAVAQLTLLIEKQGARRAEKKPEADAASAALNAVSAALPPASAATAEPPLRSTVL
jgi:hypothetical protein